MGIHTREERLNLEFEIRRLAGLLKHLLTEVDAMKFQRKIIAGEKLGSSSSSAGPRPPCNLEAISLHDAITRELKHWANTFDIDPTLADSPCDRIALRAFYIAEHPDAEYLLADLCTWIRKSEQLTGRGPSITDLASRAEQRQTAKSICWRLSKAGYPNVTSAHLLTWAARGHISAVPTPRGRTYLYTEVFAWITRD